MGCESTIYFLKDTRRDMVDGGDFLKIIYLVSEYFEYVVYSAG